MGLGHVPQEPLRPEGEGPQFQGRQRGRTSAGRDDRTRLTTAPHRARLGAWGEDRVAQWYQNSGYAVLDRNWRCSGLGEIDVVAHRGDVLVVCEVKTRSTDRYGSPAHAVTLAKQTRLRRLAVAWIREHGVSAKVIRFDVACVIGPHLEVIEAAF